MYLKELSINGFKSFAKRSELEFSSPITAIVGPNGSGKSNVAESFRFVLGEQSVKAMRGKKGEDLIWGGSEKIARGNRAGVEVVFDNSARTFALDFDAVKIERVVHRAGQNEYKLNGSAVRLKDIHELLASANIGATGHHIISQGEADRILAAGPKERREMIEDALGLKVYQLKKNESERKLEKTLENIAQVESLRREAAPHLKYLKKQVERAERSLQIQAELKKVYAEYLKREDTFIAHHTDRLSAARLTPAGELHDVKIKLVAAEKFLETATKSNTEETKAAEAIFKTASAARQESEQTLSMLQGQISLLSRRLETSERRETDSVIMRSSLESLVNDIEKDAEAALQERSEETLFKVLQSVVRSLKNFLHKERGEALDTKSADKEDLKKLTHEQKEVERTVAKAKEEEQKAETNWRSLRLAETTDREKSHQAERDVFALRASERELSITLHDIDSELAVLERDRNDFKRELQEAVSLIGRAASDYFTLEIKTAGGAPVSTEEIVHESRDAQRERHRELEKLKIRLEELGVGNTGELLEEYKTAEERDVFLARELSDLSESVKNLRSLIADLQEKLEEQFSAGIEKISLEFNRFFTLMFGGGSASLLQITLPVRKIDEEEGEPTDIVPEKGVELVVSLPNKRVKGLEMLSGGERALTSIAVIFAMSQVNPPPFIILDETDAALDEANSRRYGDMIEELAKKSQLVLITHNRETMSRAGILYGITMGGDGVSKILSVKFDEATVNAK
ncbi:MAG: AAA family ATPase [Patescibacteria group bacterium]